MKKETEDHTRFKQYYGPETQEFLVLNTEDYGGGVKFNSSWVAVLHFYAGIDLQTQELITEPIRCNWYLTDKEQKEHGCSFPFYFKTNAIYHIRVTKAVQEIEDSQLGYIKKSYNILEVIEEDVKDERLLKTLEKYNSVITHKDDKYGVFTLNKRFSKLESILPWMDTTVNISIEVDIDNKETWTTAFTYLDNMMSSLPNYDHTLRKYAANKLTKLANEWAEDDDEITKEITEEQFMNRMVISSISLSNDNYFIVYFDDDDMFWGHIIDVSGSFENNIPIPKYATIAG